VKRTVLSLTVLALAVAGVQGATAAPATTKVTGGGQTLVPATGGAGNTIAFTAQTDGTTVKGQFQDIDRNGTGTGKGQQVTHGTVTCLVVFGEDRGMAVIEGLAKDGVTRYRIDVTDSGSGAQGMDMILVRKGAEIRDEDGDGRACDPDDAPDRLPALDRGNVTIHKTR
jgi:hypothetical protein